MKRINVVTNHTNGAGLQKDGELISSLFQKAGHEVRKVQFDSPRIIQDAIPNADLNIFLEVVVPGLMGGAAANWMIPNSEWWFDHAWFQTLTRFTRVLCKTQDCLDIWIRKVGAQRCRMIGFEANDYHMPQITKQPKFLHLAGKSETKNTAAVMDAWRQGIPYQITVSAFKPSIMKLCEGVPNVTLVERFPEADIPRIMNEHQFFVMPSKYEGFGMAMHEALSCSGIVITTDAPPMRDFAGIPQELLIISRKREPVRAAFFNHVEPVHVAQAVMKAASLSPARLAELGAQARVGYLKERDYFRKAFAEVMRESGF